MSGGDEPEYLRKARIARMVGNTPTHAETAARLAATLRRRARALREWGLGDIIEQGPEELDAFAYELGEAAYMLELAASLNIGSAVPLNADPPTEGMLDNDHT
jgi:hypothetical protein